MDSVYSIPCKDREHADIGQTKRQVWSFKNQSFSVKNKTQLCLNRLAKPTMQLGAIFLKLLLATSG